MAGPRDRVSTGCLIYPPSESSPLLFIEWGLTAGATWHEFQNDYFEKIRVFKAGEYALNTLAWDNTMDSEPISLVSEHGVTINRDSWGDSYSGDRGEIL